MPYQEHGAKHIEVNQIQGCLVAGMGGSGGRRRPIGLPVGGIRPRLGSPRGCLILFRGPKRTLMKIEAPPGESIRRMSLRWCPERRIAPPENDGISTKKKDWPFPGRCHETLKHRGCGLDIAVVQHQISDLPLAENTARTFKSGGIAQQRAAHRHVVGCCAGTEAPARVAETLLFF